MTDAASEGLHNTQPTWVRLAIGEIAKIVAGGTPSSADRSSFAPQGKGTAWLTPADLSGYRGMYIERGARDLTSSGMKACSARLMPKGTVLFSSRAPIGYVAIAANDITTNQGFKSFVFPPDIDSRFAYYQLRMLKPVAEAMATGTTFKEISGSVAAKLPFKVAPVAEQRRIADKLDALLARVDAVNDCLAHVAPLLKRFRQSVLAAATSGRLTDEWRKLHYAPPMSKTTLQEICLHNRVITYGVVKLGAEVSDGTPCLRTSNVRWLRFNLEGMKRIDQNLSAEYGRTVLSGGEVLVNVRGTLGGVVMVEPEMVGWNVSREVAVIPVDPSVANPKFIAYWIASDECQRWLTAVAKGVAYTGINIEDLRKLPLSLPSIQEQTEIVRSVELLFAYVDRLDARLRNAQIATGRLTPALLAKAFRGELVPQDPDDEPAKELLMRLLASAKPATSKRGKGRTE